MWFGVHLAGVPFGRAALVRVFGSMWMMAAFSAAALATVDDAQAQHRGLFWFAIGHAVVWLVVLTQVATVWGPGLGDHVVGVMAGVSFVLFYLWLVAEGEFPREDPIDTGIFGERVESWRRPVGPGEPLRSQYEQKIRQAAAQEERNRLARDLHDSIKQQIFAIQTAAATAQTRFDGDPSGAREALDQIRGSAREAMTEMEVMLDQLRAEPPENTGLVEALKKLCESIGFRTGAQVEFKLGVMPPTRLLAPGAAEATLRAAQEALANVARHARASRVLVSLGSVGGGLELIVKDDGAGFDPNQSSRGMGRANMRTRAEEFGGRLELSSSPEVGTTVKFSIPYAAAGRNKYRNRGIALCLMMLGGVFLNRVGGHWSIAPAVAFVATISVVHYLKVYRARRLSEIAR